MKLNNRGDMAVTEAILIVVLMVAFGFLMWRETGKHTQSNSFDGGSTQDSTTNNHYSLFDFFPLSFRGCDRSTPLKDQLPLINQSK